ncbi:MAG: outer membrane protein assembly factor BamD [Gammaproteobacteria bacterium]|nr:outer membrane protein assembly factor BamD [Gammaproteobacteria bacterium]
MQSTFSRSALSLILTLAVSVLLSGCSVFGVEEDPSTWPVERVYQEARQALNNEDYEVAIDHYESLISRYPFGDYAKQAQLDVAYAYYKFDEPESAISAANHFIKLYPRHERVDYAIYLKGLVRFNQGADNIDSLFKLDPTERDPGSSRESLQYFRELTSRYPDSPYTHDAQQRIIYLHNKLARHEIHVIDYYLRRGAYLAAANRAKAVLVRYQQTPSVVDALQMMVQAYRQLKLDDLAADAQRVLELNFPEYKDS